MTTRPSLNPSAKPFEPIPWISQFKCQPQHPFPFATKTTPPTEDKYSHQQMCEQDSEHKARLSICINEELERAHLVTKLVSFQPPQREPHMIEQSILPPKIRVFVRPPAKKICAMNTFDDQFLRPYVCGAQSGKSPCVRSSMCLSLFYRLFRFGVMYVIALGTWLDRLPRTWVSI